MKKLLSVLLALTLLVTPAAASQALGWELVRSETVIGPGVSLTTQKLWGDSRSDYRTEQFVTYTPGQGVSPVVAYGPNIPAKATLTSMAKALEEYGGRVLAGANGDYFVVATGVPLGMVTTWGVLRSSSSYLYAVGFDADGKAFIGKPELTVGVELKGQSLAAMGGYNKSRVAKDGLTLFNQDFGAATKGAGKGINVILRPVVIPEDQTPPVYQAPDVTPPEAPVPVTDPFTGEVTGPSEEELAAYQTALEAYLTVLSEAQSAYETALAEWARLLASAPAQMTVGGETVTCVVTAVSEQEGAVAIPEGCFILTVGLESGDYLSGQLSALKVGEQVKLSVTSPDPRWGEAQQAIGGYALLLKDGVVQEGLDNTANPRTALGIKADGSVILYTVDGRQSGHSVGASMRQVAARLKELGCVDAVLFDGGGSTTFGATGALDAAFSLQNKPSDGGQRAVTNALFFVSELKPTGELGSLHITPQSGLFLPGGKAVLTAQGIDSGYYPMTAAVGAATYDVSGPGAVAGNVFTAGAATEKTEAVVTATAAGGQRGSTVLTVVPTPHGITLSDEATGQAVTSLNLDPGQTLPLSAAAVWYGLPMTASDDCFTWSVTPEVGSVDAAGTLTAGSKAAVGSVTVAAGAKSVSVPVTVGGHVMLLESWEEGSTLPVLDDPEGALCVELSREQVRYGKSALKVEYPSWTDSVLPLNLPIAAGESRLDLWLYAGDDGLKSLEAEFALVDGTAVTVPLATGTAEAAWRRVGCELPEGTASLKAMHITPDQHVADPVPGVVIPSGMYMSTLYLDHMTTANGPIFDTTPPTVKLTMENGTVKAVLSDNVDKTFDPARISFTLDGKAVDFVINGATAAVWLDLRDALLHRISVTVSDTSGNLARASLELPPAVDNVSPFADVEGHWGRNYADYLYDRGISNGSPGPNGTLLFQPGDNITRGDFVTMLMRWLGADLSQYEDVKLPFEDLSAIQPWALNAIRAAYFQGIFTGSAAGDLLYANATQPITRAQAMALLGRVQAKGYAPAGETFLDQADIPAWATEHVAALVGQGVVNGFGGYVRPNDPITRAEVAKVLTMMW